MLSPQPKPRYNDFLKEAMNLELKNNDGGMPILKPNHILKDVDVSNAGMTLSPRIDQSNLHITTTMSINKRSSNVSLDCSTVNWHKTYWSKSPV